MSDFYVSDVAFENKIKRLVVEKGSDTWKNEIFKTDFSMIEKIENKPKYILFTKNHETELVAIFQDINNYGDGDCKLKNMRIYQKDIKEIAIELENEYKYLDKYKTKEEREEYDKQIMNKKNDKRSRPAIIALKKYMTKGDNLDFYPKDGKMKSLLYTVLMNNRVC